LGGRRIVTTQPAEQSGGHSNALFAAPDQHEHTSSYPAVTSPNGRYLRPILSREPALHIRTDLNEAPALQVLRVAIDTVTGTHLEWPRSKDLILSGFPCAPSAETVSRLLGLLYEAAASPGCWPDFLDAVRQKNGGAGSLLPGQFLLDKCVFWLVQIHGSRCTQFVTQHLAARALFFLDTTYGWWTAWPYVSSFTIRECWHSPGHSLARRDGAYRHLERTGGGPTHGPAATVLAIPGLT